MKKLFCLVGFHAWTTQDTRAVKLRNRQREVISTGVATLQKCAHCDKKRAWMEDAFGEITVLSATVHEENIAKVDSGKKRQWRNV